MMDEDKEVAAPEDEQPHTIPDHEPEPETAEADGEADGEDDGEPGDGDEPDGEDPEDKPEPKRKRPGKYQRTVSRLEAELEQVKALLRQQPAQPQRRAPEAARRPMQEEFTDYTEYLRADARWEAQEATRQIIQQERQQFARTQAQRSHQEASARYAKAEDAVRAKYDDYDDVIEDGLRSVTVTSDMAQAIMGSENGPEIEYHLYTHPAEATSIAGMDPYSQVRAIGRLEAKLLTPSPKKTTTAPKPVKPLGGTGAGGVGQTDPAKMDMEQYVAWRQKGGG